MFRQALLLAMLSAPSLANAAETSRYLRFAVSHYRRMSEWVFYRKLELTPQATSELVEAANPFGVYRTPAEAASILEKYNLRAKEAANAGDVAAVSDRALIMRTPARRSFAHGGTSPHRAVSTTRACRLAETRTTGTGSVGATFQLGGGAGVTTTASNSWLRSASLRVVAYRPHMVGNGTPRRADPGADIPRQNGGCDRSSRRPPT